MSLPVKILLWVIGGAAGLIILWWVFCIICALFIDTRKTYTHESKFFRFLLNVSTDMAMIGARLKIHVSGKEKIPEGRFLLVSNHISNFDPIVQWHVLKNSHLSYLSKAENFKIFTFGPISKKCCFLPINREDPREAMKALITAAELIKSDEVSFGVFPEGTRSKDGVLLPFHDGVLKVAKLANVPIVVVVMRGTNLIHKNYPFRSTDIYMDIVDVIPADIVKAESTHTISDKVRKEILKITGE